MTLQQENRIRRNDGQAVVLEVRAAEADDLADISLSEEKIRLRADQVYRSRGGVPGSAVMDWMRAEIELGAGQCNE